MDINKDKSAKEPEVELENGAEEAIDELQKLTLELDDSKDRYVRLYAEFDNYKRRTSRERVEMMQMAGKEVIGNLLTVLDDFERALKMMENSTDVPSIMEGLDLINQKFTKILTQEGLKKMDAIGQVFDADFHEAITNIPAPSPDLKGKVLDEVEKGYLLNDKVLRYAKVVVGK